MSRAAVYSSIERLRDGSRVEIRSLRPDDRAGLIAAIGRTSPDSLFRRFFAVKRSFTEREIEFFLNVDFVSQVALVAVTEEDGRSEIVGGGRYVVLQPGTAELAFAVIDEYQQKGIGTALMRHLISIARESGLKELVAEVLPDNTPMLKVFRSSGLPVDIQRQSGAVHIVLSLT
jgi:ribosomal protein S18 acetylase RimI-like enzyme